MAQNLNGTPRSDGFYMPGEFEQHEGCWMSWPERTDNWRLGGKPAQKAFAEVANTIAEYEQVTMCVSHQQFEAARELLSPEVRLVEMSLDDSWMRDIGPTFVVNDAGDIRGVDWRFNAWGGLVDGLYFPWDKDDQAARKICEIERIDYYSLESFVLEGGSIHSDGEGTVIVTEECLLHESRNRELSKAQIEEQLKVYLGAEKVLWIPEGIYLDETNGHVDNIIHYCAPGVIVLAWTDDENDPQFSRSSKAYDYLSKVKDAKGRSLSIHKLHIPSEVLITKEESEGVDKIDGTLPRIEGDRQAASYANFYIANGAIILPLFGDDTYDKKAIEVLKSVFPDRVIRGIYAREIILGGGNIHCITQQQPMVK